MPKSRKVLPPHFEEMLTVVRGLEEYVHTLRLSIEDDVAEGRDLIETLYGVADINVPEMQAMLDLIDEISRRPIRG